MPVDEHAAEHGVEAAVICPTQAKGQQRDVCHGVALGHEVAAVELQRRDALESPIEPCVLAKLEALRLVGVGLAVSVEHVALHKGTVAVGEVLLRPWCLEQRDRILLCHLGIDVAAVHMRHAPEGEVGEELTSVVLPRVVLPDSVVDAHHTDFSVYVPLDGRPLGRFAVTVGDRHECADDGVHTAP